MHNIEIGGKGRETLLVTPEVTANFLGPDAARVLSTPQMILYMERASRLNILRFLDPGYDTVGTKVNISHLAGAPVGATVNFVAEIVASNGRRVEFRVEAWNGTEKIGEGTHERAIINVEKFAARQAEKSRGA